MRWKQRIACFGFVLCLIFPDPAWPDSDILRANCPGKVSCRIDTLSRSRICLDLNEKDPCVVQGIVGGEHISTIQVNGKAGASFMVLFAPVTGRPEYWIDRSAASVISLGRNQARVKLNMDVQSFEISLSAHPYGEYEITLKALTP